VVASFRIPDAMRWALWQAGGLWSGLDGQDVAKSSTRPGKA
jgi:hypothetical protein